MSELVRYPLSLSKYIISQPIKQSTGKVLHLSKMRPPTRRVCLTWSPGRCGWHRGMRPCYSRQARSLLICLGVWKGHWWRKGWKRVLMSPVSRLWNTIVVIIFVRLVCGGGLSWEFLLVFFWFAWGVKTIPVLPVLLLLHSDDPGWYGRQLGDLSLLREHKTFCTRGKFVPLPTKSEYLHDFLQPLYHDKGEWRTGTSGLDMKLYNLAFRGQKQSVTENVEAKGRL